MKKNMERVPQALLDEINKAFVDLEEACLAPLYREYRLRRRTLKREYNNCDYPDSHIQIIGGKRAIRFTTALIKTFLI